MSDEKAAKMTVEEHAAEAERLLGCEGTEALLVAEVRRLRTVTDATR